MHVYFVYFLVTALEDEIKNIETEIHSLFRDGNGLQ